MSNIQATRIQSFITLINERLLKASSDGVDKLNQLWKEITHYETCKEIVKTAGKKADRTGQACGKACLAGKETCMAHTPREKKEKIVKVIVRCDAVCPKGTCKREMVADGKCALHQPKEAPAPCEFVLLVGKKANMPCGHSSVKGTTICKRHTPSETIILPSYTPIIGEEKVVEVSPINEIAPVESVVSDEAPTVSTKEKKPRKTKTNVVVEKVDVEAPKEVMSTVSTEKTDAVIPSISFRPKSPDFPPPSDIKEQAVIAPMVPTETEIIDEEKICSWIMKAGVKKGSTCGKKCAAGKSLCVLHQ